MESETLTFTRMQFDEISPDQIEPLLDHEWLVTNGLGGYASGTVSGVVTRRYHGLLVAALPVPHGRTVMLTHLLKEIRLPDGRLVRVGGDELGQGQLDYTGAHHLKEFKLEAGLPVWRYEVDGIAFEKRVLMPHLQNTVHVTYRLLAGGPRAQLRLRPSMHFLPHEASVSEPLHHPYMVTGVGHRFEVSPHTDIPPLRLYLYGRGVFTQDGGHFREVFYRMEQSRGYDSNGVLYSPGYFQAELSEDSEITLVASTEPWDVILALKPADAQHAELERRQRLLATAHPKARNGIGAELVQAADQFIITPSTRAADAARAQAAGDEVRTIIAGYHWFTDWGRDTMISLEGLTLTTGRHDEAGFILRTFAHYIRNGLIPNMFPEGEKEGLYHTADATLWFFHAIERYLEHTGDRITLRLLLPKLQEIVERHIQGTRFNIGVDPRDGLLRQGQEGYQLTWMDAKVEGWVVTPRRGKAVEINALWYNALRLLEKWLREEKGSEAARPIQRRADQVRESFNRRFWYEAGGYLYDVVDGEDGTDDPALRPNQIFAISLPHPVLDRPRWEPVLEVVRSQLLTPVGLRSLAPSDPAFKAQYNGDLRARDAAYHQGTVWGWLIGPFIDAWLKVHEQDRAGARKILGGVLAQLGEAGVGSISEIFDAEPPFTPRGCITQAWSVAEALRCWVRTAE